MAKYKILTQWNGQEAGAEVEMPENEGAPLVADGTLEVVNEEVASSESSDASTESTDSTAGSESSESSESSDKGEEATQ